ncbi:MAG: methyltransferase [Parabacteroides sp.]|nr:methyltransferase [Parabacteroides sp.]
MANSYFEFKKFTVRQDLCAMKVGTDGVLLGAWASLAGCRDVLDVGTGTGLITLMLAQRGESENRLLQIDAIDIEPGAVKQAILNIQASPFSDRIHAECRSFVSYARLSEKRYDLIVSNPPYFHNSLKCPDVQRNTARHTDTLTLKELLEGGSRLLLPAGRIALILPADRKEELARLSESLGLNIIRQTDVSSVEGKPPKRLLAELSFDTSGCMYNSMALETALHRYTSEFTELVKAFYLKI